MSMQIKTIVSPNVDIFDEAVNRLLTEGWKLMERKLVQTPAGTKDYCYAEFIKEDDPQPEPAPITWQQAVNTIKGICSSRVDCVNGDECPLFSFCHRIDVWSNPCDWPEVPHD